MVQAAKAANTTHGKGDSPEMRTWIDMRRRCHQPHRPDYRNYGARGIYVCDEWRESFAAFYRDMGDRPAGHTLERRDNDGPYSKDNCVWAPNKQQGRNRRTNVRYDVRGERLTLVEAAERYGMLVATLRSRVVQRGWSMERAISEPIRLLHHLD